MSPDMGRNRSTADCLRCQWLSLSHTFAATLWDGIQVRRKPKHCFAVRFLVKLLKETVESLRLMRYFFSFLHYLPHALPLTALLLALGRP